MSTPSSDSVRRLIVMRHAKSSWAEMGQSDHARPLNQRGRRDAPKVATQLVQMEWCPDFVLSSDAQRTQDTWQLMLEAFESRGLSPECTFTNQLYLAGYMELLDEIAVVDDSIQTLLVLGHNPGWEGIVHTLTGDSVTLKTANAALLEGEGASWQDALRRRGNWRRHEQIVSRNLS